MESARYGAFISYRHSADDRRFAQRLHAELEAWSTPARLVQQGARAKVGRVFRDEEELAASADLSAEIDSALMSSDALVVVCSPRTPGSRWVNEEVLRFRALGRSDRILACLIEGEPAESFPPALLAAMDGSAREPLAADFRPPVEGSAAAAHRLAKLRLLATLVGCRFDDLVLREQARRRLRATLAAGALLGVTAVIGVLALVAVEQRDAAEAQRRVADQRRDATLLTQSRFLASLSTQSLAEGHASLAALLAIEALPRPGASEDRPYHSPAMAALYAAMLGQREQLTLGGGGRDPSGGPTPAVAAAQFTTDGQRLVVGTASGAVEVWDIDARRRRAAVSLGGTPVQRLAFDGAGRMGVAAAGGQLFEVDLDRGQATPIASLPGRVEGLTLHDQGASFVTVASDNEVLRAQRWTRGGDGRFAAGPAAEWTIDLLYHHAVSPDGRTLAHGDARTTGLALVDLVGGTRRVLEPPVFKSDRGTLFATFSPTGDRLLASSARHVVILALAGRSAPVVLSGHHDSVLRASFAPDGRAVATGGEDGQVLLWGPENGFARPLRSFGGFRRGENQALQQGSEIERTLLAAPRMHSLFEGAVGHLAFSADATRLVIVSGDRALSVHDLRGEAQPLRLTGHGGKVDGLAITADGTRVMSLDREGAARVWTTREARPLILAPGHSSVSDVHMPVGHTPPLVLVRHSQTRCGGLWRAWRLGAPVPMGPASAPMGTLSFDGGTLLAGEPEAGLLQRVDLASGGTHPVDLPAGASPVDCAYVDPLRQEVVLTFQEGPDRRQRLPGPPPAAASAPAPAVPADAAHGAVVQALLSRGATPPPDESEPRRFHFNRERDRLLLWRPDGDVSLLDLRTGAELRRLKVRMGGTARTATEDDGHGFVFSDDGRHVLSLRPAGVRLWQASDGQVLRDVPVRAGEPRFATLGGMPSKRLVVLESERIVVYDLADGRLVAERPTPVEDGAQARLSPDGRRLAVGGREPCGTLWETDTLTKIADLALPAGCPTSFHFSPDGSTLLTTVWEPQGLALWDARGGAQLARHRGCRFGDDEMGDGDPGDVMTAGFSADGLHVFVGTLGGVVCVWPHPGGGMALLAEARRRLARGLSAAEQARLPVEPPPLR